MLEGDIFGFSNAQSLNLKGQIRNFVPFTENKILVGINNQPILIVE